MSGVLWSQYLFPLVQAIEVEPLLVVVGTLIAFIVVMEVWYRRFHPGLELFENLFRFGVGTLVVLFPWIFSAVASALVALVTLLLFCGFAARREWLRSSFSIRGLAYLSLSALGLLFVAAQQPLLYSISLATAAVCDPLAAIIGRGRPVVPYRALVPMPNLGRSAVFFVLGFLVVHLPLLLAGLDRQHSVVLATLVALLVTFVRVATLGALRNLTIPIATCFLVVAVGGMSVASALSQLCGLVVMAGVLSLFSWWVGRFSVSGALAATVFTYVLFLFTAKEWLVAPFFAMLAFAALYVALLEVSPYRHSRVHQVRAVFYAFIPPVLLGAVHWALFYDMGVDSPIYPLFLGAVVAHLSMTWYRLLWMYRHAFGRRGPGFVVAVFLSAASWSFVVPAAVWLTLGGAVGKLFAVQTVAIPAMAMTVFYLLYRYSRWPLTTPWQFRLQVMCLVVAVVAVFAVSYFRLLLL